VSAKGYLIAEARVTDPVGYERYKTLAEAAIADHGGRYLVRGGASEILEGGWSPRRLVVVEFDSVEQAKTFYHSAAYRVAREARAEAAEMNMMVVSGVDNPV
jgi:uncharacterized protein (DUF1330 family)